MLYTIKHFVSHRLHQTADMSNTGLLINLLLLQPHRIKNRKKLTGGSQHQRQETIYIRSPFFVPSSCPSLLPQPLIRRNPRQDKVGNPQTSVGHLGPASQLCSGARGALTCSAAESRLPAHAAAAPRLSPAAASRRQLLTRVSPPRRTSLPPCPPRYLRCGRRCPPGAPRSGRSCGSGPGSARRGCGCGTSGSERGAEPSAAPGPSAAGGNTRTGSAGGVGGGTAGSRASQRPCCYKMLLAIKSW